jgi:AraC family transcriptional regulator, regulatory protein of adaptative response / DNA-3-methyladenine glycosylase II
MSIKAFSSLHIASVHRLRPCWQTAHDANNPPKGGPAADTAPSSAAQASSTRRKHRRKLPAPNPPLVNRMDDATRYQHILDRNAACDGEFITGVLTTKIYCLPSCPARKPKPDNVRYFTTETDAIAAGLRACKRCRPDLFYQGTRQNEAIYMALHQRLPSVIANIADVAALAAVTGVSRSKLNELCREHGHTTPAALLLDARLDALAVQLQQNDGSVVEIAYGLGFVSESACHSQFLTRFGLTPGAWRRLPTTSQFSLRLPVDYRAAEVLAYLGRDAHGPAERLYGHQITKALLLAGSPMRLQLTLTPGEAICTVLSLSQPSPAALLAAHRVALRCLGLSTDDSGLQRLATGNAAIERLLARRPGLRFPLSATVWEALVWAIVGQQVNLTFAATLRRVVIELAGQDAGDGMTAHPDIAAVAGLHPDSLRARQFSRSKAEYLIGTAQTLLASAWDIETMAEQSCPAVIRRLTAIRGIGPWTAQYTLLRGAGFSDCVPVGDAGLNVALQRFYGLEERPKGEAVLPLMAGFAPHRSHATAHLWASLQDVP